MFKLNLVYILTFLSIILHPGTTFSVNRFGYVDTASYNLGDDVQALAAKRLLPANSVVIDREFIGVFKSAKKVKAIVNGWFMHTKDFCWYRTDVPAPITSWPPSSRIDPLLISIHFTDGFLPAAFSNPSIKYLKAHAPIGARDFSTLKELQKRNIPSYFSGCLTLTLQNDSTDPRNDIIYAVDLDDECFEYLKSKTTTPIERITHGIDVPTSLDFKKRKEMILEILEKYKRAKCVVTTRLHAAMPCLAFETPVLFVNNRNDRRLSGLIDLARNCNKKEFLNGQFDFNFDHPGENPKDYLILRENLITTVKKWVDKNYY